jgi:hypothetical protein
MITVRVSPGGVYGSACADEAITPDKADKTRTDARRYLRDRYLRNGYPRDERL